MDDGLSGSYAPEGDGQRRLPEVGLGEIIVDVLQARFLILIRRTKR
jgi:hypothetical protein